ncbi:MAG: VWA domain-containing protein [Chloroflexota bacterium]|nr:VWA domain-containing protein [Chloroflexota bacterium]
MSFAAPLALALGLLSVPLVLLYLLKPRREERVVPSTFLWRQALEEVQANAPWQKLKRNLLLLLQLIILSLLVLALARPLLNSGIAPGGDLVLILDTSQSMAATDVRPSRWEAAVHRVRELAQNAGVGSRVAVVTAGPTPRLLAGPTADKTAVANALSDLGAPHGDSNLRDAAILARSVAGRLKEPTILLVGDGGPVASEAAPVPYTVRFDPVKGTGANAGILGLSTRSGATGRQLWVSIGNYGPARAATLSFSVDGKLVDAAKVQLPADTVTGVARDDLPPGAVIQAKLDVQDSLEADNTAWHVDAQGPPARVLLLGQESRFLERALSLLPDVQVFKGKSGAPHEPGYDIYVFNGDAPAQLPPGNVLLLGPKNSALLPVRGEMEGLPVTSQKEDSLLLRFVDLSNTSIARASRLSLPDWMETLASSGDVPLLVAGETQGRKVVALAFSPENSDLPLQVAFPVLVDNLMRHLRPQPPAVSGAVRPGETVQLPAPQQPLTVVSPDGRHARIAAGTGAYAATSLPGVYEVRNQRGAVVSRFAVNAGSANESRITESSQTPLRTDGARPDAPQRPGGAERWWPLALLALLVLLAEWWLYNRLQSRTRRVRRLA